MAIITDGINTPTEELKVTSEYNVEIDLVNKSVNKLQNFPVVMKGDNNSVAIVFKAPAEYNGVDLFGTNCILSYNTTWKDDEGNFSTGQVELTVDCDHINNECTHDNKDYLLYTWVLDLQQTYKAGQCNFNINFIMNLENDPYQDNVNVVIIDGSDGEQYFGSNSIIETELKYWSVSTSSVSFEIIDTNTSFNGDINLIVPIDVGLAIETLQDDLKNTQDNIITMNEDIIQKIETNENHMYSELGNINDELGHINGELGSIKNYIITEYEKDGWKCREYNDGFKVCSCQYKSSNAVFNRTDGSMYYSDGIQFANYPFTFIELPSTHIDYIGADPGVSKPCFIMKGFGNSPVSGESVQNGTRTRPPHIWLYSYNNETVGHPVFNITAWGY